MTFPIPIRARVLLLAALAAVCAVSLLLLGRLPQDPGYHVLADTRRIWGIPNFWNVASNLGFVLAGLVGLAELRRAEAGHAVPSPDAAALTLFFLGNVLTAFGSAFYHLAPSNDRLVWDRLPMTLAFVAFFTAVVSDRVSPRLGRALLVPGLGIGLASVLLWWITERLGHGDLRLYAFVQFFPLLAVPAMLLLFPPRFTRGAVLAWTLLLYGAAKLAETFDSRIYDALGGISGHSLKHLLAAGSTLAVAAWVRVRRPAPTLLADDLRIKTEEA